MTLGELKKEIKRMEIDHPNIDDDSYVMVTVKLLDDRDVESIYVESDGDLFLQLRK